MFQAVKIFIDFRLLKQWEISIFYAREYDILIKEKWCPKIQPQHGPADKIFSTSQKFGELFTRRLVSRSIMGPMNKNYRHQPKFLTIFSSNSASVLYFSQVSTIF